MEKLSGRTVLVTGSTDGVGRSVALKLGQAGAHVLVHGRNAERGARVVADIEASGAAGTFLAADLSALAEVRRLAGAVQATADRLDILINNAGIGTAGHWGSGRPDQYADPWQGVHGLCCPHESCYLLEHGEDRLLVAVERGAVPANIATEIARAPDIDQIVRAASGGGQPTADNGP